MLRRLSLFLDASGVLANLNLDRRTPRVLGLVCVVASITCAVACISLALPANPSVESPALPLPLFYTATTDYRVIDGFECQEDSLSFA